jgi:hypothetical protein
MAVPGAGPIHIAVSQTAPYVGVATFIGQSGVLAQRTDSDRGDLIEDLLGDLAGSVWGDLSLLPISISNGAPITLFA